MIELNGSKCHFHELTSQAEAEASQLGQLPPFSSLVAATLLIHFNHFKPIKGIFFLTLFRQLNSIISGGKQTKAGLIQVDGPRSAS